MDDRDLFFSDARRGVGRLVLWLVGFVAVGFLVVWQPWTLLVFALFPVVAWSAVLGQHIRHKEDSL